MPLLVVVDDGGMVLGVWCRATQKFMAKHMT